MGFAEIRVQMRRVRGALTRMLTDRTDLTHRVAETLEALDEGERLLDELAADRLTASGVRRGVPKSYRVEKHDKEEFLAEKREGEDSPFRVSRGVYDALTTVMLRLKDFVRYDDIAKGVRKETAQAVPEYQIRMVLRFWAERGAIERSRARYRRSASGEWPAVALEAWRDARRPRSS
jgi:hypothetical protein